MLLLQLLLSLLQMQSRVGAALLGHRSCHCRKKGLMRFARTRFAFLVLVLHQRHHLRLLACISTHLLSVWVVTRLLGNSLELG
jgi:hypothetical protein